MIMIDGQTFNPDLDAERLNTQGARVWQLMRDSNWRTLSEIQAECGGSEAGVSARLRDFRKREWGGNTVRRRRRGDSRNGLYEYRLIPNFVQEEFFFE